MPDPRDDQSELERAIARALAQGRISRRRFLRQAGTGGLLTASALSLPAILPRAASSPRRARVPAPAAAPPSRRCRCRSSPAGTLNWANWPAYIDIDDTTGDYPTIKKFAAETHITVNYNEDINDNEEFFGKIQPDLPPGNPTQYDLIVPTDWMIERMIRLGYLEPLDKSRIPSFDRQRAGPVQGPVVRPGQRLQHARGSRASPASATTRSSLPSGREAGITSFDDLLDPAFKGQVGMFSEMRDTMSLTLLSARREARTTPPTTTPSGRRRSSSRPRTGRPVPGLLRQRLLRRCSAARTSPSPSRGPAT